MTNIVKEGTEHTGKNQEATTEKVVDSPHYQETQDATGQTVKQAHHMTKEKGTEKNARDKYAKSLFCREIFQYQKCDDIRQPQLDTGYGD